MTTVYDVPAEAFIPKLAGELKENSSVKTPVWASFVKTGVHNERPPQQSDWWFIRAASLLRRVYLDGPVGVIRLRTYYGGKKNRGHRPEKRMPGSGAIVRNLLHQLNEAGFVETTPRGRIVTTKGRSLLDKVSHDVKLSLVKEMPELKKY
ncbi:MAG: 30S ribosomal protein S19e [Candidatus Methanofastidiosia archaeon]